MKKITEFVIQEETFVGVLSPQEGGSVAVTSSVWTITSPKVSAPLLTIDALPLNLYLVPEVAEVPIVQVTVESVDPEAILQVKAWLKVKYSFLVFFKNIKNLKNWINLTHKHLYEESIP